MKKVNLELVVQRKFFEEWMRLNYPIVGWYECPSLARNTDDSYYIGTLDIFHEMWLEGFYFSNKEEQSFNKGLKDAHIKILKNPTQHCHKSWGECWKAAVARNN